MESKDVPKKYPPKFLKLDDIKPGHHGYNVYVKVLSSEIQTIKDAERGDLKIAQAVVGDETAVINARIVGEYAHLFEKDNLLAIRNGKSEVFKEHHRLELDPWGKATLETGHPIEKIDTNNNKSTIAYEAKLQPRNNDRGDRDRREKKY